MSVVSTLKEYIPAALTPGGNKTPAQALPFKNYEEFLQMSDGTFRCILKVSAINNELLADDENDSIVEYMQEAINAVQSGFSQITVSSEKLNLDEYIEYLEDKYQDTKESYFMERLDAMIEYVKRTSVRQRTTKSFYFTLVSKTSDINRARDDFDEAVRKIEEALGSAEIYVKILKKHDGMRMLYEKLNPITSVQQPFTADQTTFQSIAPVPIKHYEYHSEMDGIFYRFYTIIDYPEATFPAWMTKVFNVNAEVDVSLILQQTGKKKMVESIDHSIGLIRYRLNKPGTKESEMIDYEKKATSARKLLEDLSSDAELMYNVTTIVAVKERSLKELQIASERVLTAIQTSNMKTRQLILMGNDPFWMSLPVAYNSSFLTNENLYWPMQSSIIGSILPFNSSDFMMKTGVVMGRNPATNSLIICDRRDKKRVDNPNLCVIAPSGRGKSWWAEANISRENSLGTKCIVIDPDREYKFKFGERVVFSIGSYFCTNPFHIRSAILDLDDEDEENSSTNYTEKVGQYLQRKIADLIPFFRQVYPKMDSTEEADLMEAIQNMYKEISNLDFESTELPAVFPTMSDFDAVIAAEEFKESLGTFRKNLRPYVSGVYKNMFNGQTNWSMDSMLTILDINSLSPVIQPQMMYLLLQDIWEYVKKDRKEQKGLYVDEAWKLADPDNPQTLKFLFEMAKRIRKYGGFLTTITQSVDDFFGSGKGSKNYGQAIFDNAFFKLFLGLSEKDYKTLEDTGFTFSRKEERILKRRKSKGKGVFIAGSTRVEIHATPLIDELQFIDPAEYKKVKDLNHGMDYTEIEAS
jgi:conjugal transfer ATP-binding protein TraC